MKKTVCSLSAVVLISSVLVGCAGNNNGAPRTTRDNMGNTTHPISYYAGQRNAGNGLWHTGRQAGYNRMNVNNNREFNPGFNNNVSNNARSRHKRDAQTIANKVANLKNVQHANVVVTNNDVLVGVDTSDQGVTRNYKQQIRRVVETVVTGKDIHVTTDPAMNQRINSVSQNLRGNGMTREIGSDIRGIIGDLGNAATRPFTRNTR